MEDACAFAYRTAGIILSSLQTSCLLSGVRLRVESWVLHSTSRSPARATVVFCIARTLRSISTTQMIRSCALQRRLTPLWCSFCLGALWDLHLCQTQAGFGRLRARQENRPVQRVACSAAPNFDVEVIPGSISIAAGSSRATARQSDARQRASSGRPAAERVALLAASTTARQGHRRCLGRVEGFNTRTASGLLRVWGRTARSSRTSCTAMFCTARAAADTGTHCRDLALCMEVSYARPVTRGACFAALSNTASTRS